MIKDWINLTRVNIEGAERLYPKGLDWNLAPGINTIIGGTGLGKTTLVYAMQFAVFGKLVIDSAERIEREFFKDRLTNRSRKKLEKNPPLVLVEFAVNSIAFSVKRNLLTGVIVEAKCDGAEISTKKYDGLLAEKIGIMDDFPSLTRLQSHLFFFGESRYLLAWENRLQHELINLMLADHSTYQQLDDLWTKVESADSTARNISAQASRLEKDFETVSQSKSKVAELQMRSDASQLTSLRVEQEKRVVAIQKRIADDEKLEVSQSEKITRIHAEFHNALEELEATQSSDLDGFVYIIEVKWVGQSLKATKQLETKQAIETELKKRGSDWFTEYGTEAFEFGAKQLAKYFSTGKYQRAYLAVFDCNQTVTTRANAALPVDPAHVSPHSPSDFCALRACVNPRKASTVSKTKQP